MIENSETKFTFMQNWKIEYLEKNIKDCFSGRIRIRIILLDRIPIDQSQPGFMPALNIKKKKRISIRFFKSLGIVRKKGMKKCLTLLIQ